ncbi:hypothetical protein JCM10213_000639 [Rhodosporidiobolus nylandii]
MPPRASTSTYGQPQRPPAQLEKSYRVRRTAILRDLGKSCQRNGSQFAILWVSPTGEQTEVFASEALCGRLQDWLGREAQTTAKECVRASREEREQRRRVGLEVYDADKIFGPQGEVYDLGQPADVDTDDEGEAVSGPNSFDELMDVPSELPGPRGHAGASRNESLPTPTRVSGATLASSSTHPPSRITRSNSSAHLSGQQPSPAPSPASLPSPAHAPSPFSTTSASGPARSSTPRVPWQFTPQSVQAWYEARFSELLHAAMKLVCKAWIKTIEPAKQTNYPYHQGDDSKPSWWPSEVRHKEPDHLKQTERVALLVHLVRHSPLPVEDLETALEYVDTRQLGDKLPVLQEILRVGKEERRAVQRSGNGTFDSFTVVLTSLTPKQEDDDEPKQHNTRHRARCSVGNTDGLTPPSQPQQQTPRSRASPYPLSRSHSVSDMAASHASPIRSPGLSTSLSASSGMSRSQSLAGPISSAGKPRNARQGGRHSLGEADLLDPSSAAGMAAAQLQTTPYARNGAKASVTPRHGQQGQGSPLASAAGMSRSCSTSALLVPPSTAKKPSTIDDSVASPAMIKSRSRLSQQHFDLMGLGGKNGTPPSATKRGHMPQQGRPGQPHFHPHHLAQLQLVDGQGLPQLPQLPPNGAPQRPPLHHSHTQPLPFSHGGAGGQRLQRIPSGHLPQPPQQPQPVLLYQHAGNGASGAPGLVRTASAHQLPAIPHGHGGGPNHHAHHLPPPTSAHNPHHHSTQVQVQVQVHQLPPEFQRHPNPDGGAGLQNFPSHHRPSQPPQYGHQHHVQQQQQAHQAMRELHAREQQLSQSAQVAQHAQFASYPTPVTGTYASPNFSAAAGSAGSPFLAQSQSSVGGFAGDEQLQAEQGDSFLANESSSLSGHADGMGGMAEYLADPSSSSSTPGVGYGTSPLLPPSSCAGGAGNGVEQADLSAYMQTLEELSPSNPTQPLAGAGFDLEGLGLGGFGGMDGMAMAMEPGYYGEESGFGTVGA